MSNRLRVALVGSAFQENLGLEYLAAVAQTRGHEVKSIAYGSRGSAPGVIAEVLGAAVDLVGLSIAYQACLTDSTYLAIALRSAGFTGHITCGGHVATFEYEALLRDCPAIDSAVRHDGEYTFLELLERLAQGTTLSGTAGLVWRDGSTIRIEPPRAPIRCLDELPFPTRQIPSRLFAGVPMSLVIGSRGCMGLCAYCCIRAFAQQASGPVLRLREPEAIAREVAELSRQSPLSAIFFEDDLFILPSETRAVERMRAIRCSLQKYDVTGCAFWAKGQPDRLTPAIVEAAKELGIVHLFLGIENNVTERLRYLGRSHGPEHNEAALTLLRESGVGVSFNLMLFDPDCCLDDVAENVDFAAAHLDLPWNLCRTELYSGTELLERVRAEGRLLGDYRSYGYTMRDPRAELMFRILRVCFHSHAFEASSLLNQVVSLFFGVQMHQRLIPDPEADALASAIDELAVVVHRDTVDTLRQIIDFAAHADFEDTRAARQFALTQGLAINNRDLTWRRRSEDLTRWLDARGRAATARKLGAKA